MHKRPYKKISLTLASLHFITIACPPEVLAGTFTVFRETYSREAGAPQTVTNTFDVLNPNTTWTLRAINGSLEDDTVEKVSSSTVTLNGTEVLRPNQFNQNTAVIEEFVPLNSSNTITTELRSKPGGQLTIEIFGQDEAPPMISDISPPNGITISDPRPVISATYTDAISGINPDSVVLKLDGADITDQASVTATSVSFTPTTNITLGQHTIEVHVADQAGNLAIAQTAFTSLFNAPPVLNPIGNRTVPLGTTLTLMLIATDSDNDPLAFSATPLPLPNNASLHATTGAFSFKPTTDQVGTLTLTFLVTDGELRDSETITITVEAAPLGGVTALTGRILDTNDFTQGIERPVVGATVSLLGTGFSTTSDTNGQFTLSGIPAGSQILDIDTATANAAPDGSPYAGFREEIGLVAGVTNVVNRPFFLPRIAQESLTAVDPNTTTMVENPTLGITMEVPPHTAKNADGTDFTGQLSISEVPEGLAPAALPAELQPGLIITIQPVGVSYSQPVPITFPNIDNLSPGSEVDLWSLDPDAGRFVVVGTGRVSADGSVIETINGGIRANDWHMFLAAAVAPGAIEVASEIISEEKCTDLGNRGDPSGCYGSQVSIHSGNLSEGHTLASQRSQGQSRALELIYNSREANPQPAISVEAIISQRSAVPPSISKSLRVGGVLQQIVGRPLDVETFTDTSPLNENINEAVLQAVQFDANTFETGRYPFELTLTNHYTRSSVSTVVRGNVLVNNQQNSPFGAGWTLEGLQRLRIQADGNALITEGDGSFLTFTPGGGICTSAPAGLVGWWPLDEPSGSTAADITGGNNGTHAGSPSPVSGKVGGALSFDGIDDEVRVNSTFPFHQPGDATLEFWINTPAPDHQSVFWTRPDNSDTNRFNIFIDGDSTFGFDYRSPGGTLHTLVNRFIVGIPRSEWAHLAIARTGNVYDLYVNSALAASATDVAPHLPAAIGWQMSGRGGFIFNGVLDEVSLYNRALSASEIQAIVNAGAGGKCKGGAPGGGEGTFRAPVGDFSTLVENADGTFTRTLKDGTQLRFDANGLHTATIDRNGNTTTYTYDAQGRVTTITDPAGLVTTLAYTGDNLSGITDPVGRTTTFEHDADGNLSRIVDPDGTSRTFAYDSNHRLISKTNKRNFTTTYDYDFAGRNIGVARPDGSSRQVSPVEIVGLIDPTSGLGTETFPAPVVRPEAAVATFTNGNSKVTQFETDSFGAATLTTDALGRTTSIERDQHSNPTKITQPNGAITSMTYDVRGNLLTVTEQSISATTTFTYEPTFNQVTSIKDPKGNATTINYDAKGNPIEIIDAAGTKTTMAYADPNCPGQLTGITNAVGLPEANATSFEYDSATCNLIRTVDPLLNRTVLAYDVAGNVTQSTDAEERATRFRYDTMNRLSKVIDATNSFPDPACGTAGVTCYDYDAAGNLLQVADSKSNKIKFAYNSQDRLVETTDPLGKKETFSYDGNSNLVTTTDRKAQTLTFEYDAVDQLIKKTLPGPLITTFAYDLVGNLTSVIDPDSKLTFSYDGANRLTRTATTGSSNQPDVTITYTYDKNGNRLTMTDGFPGTTSYTYDTLNRLKSITNPSAKTINFAYDALSRRTSTTFPNGVATTYTYDTASQLLSLEHKLGGTPFSSFAYTYDRVGNRKMFNTTRTGVTVNSSLSYTYDNLYRLIQASNPLPAQPDETFNYDAVGNRLRRDGQATDASFNQANRLLEDAEFTYSYDDNGNLIQKVENGTGDTTDYTYDAENQLTRINLPGGTVAQYRYDGLGRRIEKDVSGSMTRYVYDNEDILLEFDGSNALAARYTHGAGIDEPLVMERGGQRFFYHTDGLGSITDLVDPTGTIAQSYVYDSFGNIVQQVGALLNPYTYTGREFDEESRLYHYRERYYDPRIGRFLQEDPTGPSSDLNLYSYVINSPLNFTDPIGLAIGAPSFGQSLIPVVGSGRAAINDFQEGRWGWGIVNAGLAVSDVFLVKALITGAVKVAGKTAAKTGSNTWRATRAWLTKIGFSKKGQEVHHWLIPQSGWGRFIPNWMKNQPWNLMAMKNPEFHRALHGFGEFGLTERFWYGTPTWAKAFFAALGGRIANWLRGKSDDGCY